MAQETGFDLVVHFSGLGKTEIQGQKTRAEQPGAKRMCIVACWEGCDTLRVLRVLRPQKEIYEKEDP